MKSFTTRLLYLSLLLISNFFLSAQALNESSKNSISCGSIADPDSWKQDRYFGKNDELVKNLLRHKVNIDSNYLDQIEKNDQAAMTTSESMFTHESTPFLIPIRAWIYREDNGTGNITFNELNQIITNLNTRFHTYTNIQFYLLCNVTEINNSDFAHSDNADFDEYTVNNRQLNVLNFHFVINSPDWGGRARFPWDNPNFTCAAVTEFLTAQDQANLLAHEIGHTLGLYHTHHPGRSNNQKNEDCGDCYQESVSRTRTQGFGCFGTLGQKKCEVNGDFLCDTDADPALQWNGRTPRSYVNAICLYNGLGGTDNWGTNWQPLVGNIMSWAPVNCLFYFSPLQTSKMYGYIDDIGITHPTFTITGPESLCAGQTATYTVTALAGVTTYTWQVPYSMTIISGQGTNSITVQGQNNNGGEITVTPNCGYYSASFIVQNLSFISITGPEIACTNQYLTYEAPYFANTTYTWSITNGAIVSGQGTNMVQVVLYQDPSNYSVLDVSIPSPCDPTQTVTGIIYIDHYPDNCQLRPSEQTNSSNTYDIEKSVNSKVGSRIPDSKNIQIHPNPARTIVTVTMPDSEMYDLVLINSLGQTVLRKNKVQHQLNINVGIYNEGIYIINLISKSKYYNKKLIIKK